MRFVVRHHTRYRYDVPVRLARHVLRLTPRPDQGRIVSQCIRVTPEPAQRSVTEDTHGNRLVQIDFDGSCHELRVESDFELDTFSPSELPAYLPALPWAGADVHGAEPVDPRVRDFAERLAGEVGYVATPLLDRLARTLHERIDHQVRTTGGAKPAAETLATGRGACRDVTLLFMDAVRSLGMVSRFVSGYQAHSAPGGGQRFLHAWPEVWLPGSGFRGWDPTQGRRVAGDYVALCAAPTQGETMPIEGGFYFDERVVNSTLDFSLQIETYA